MFNWDHNAYYHRLLLRQMPQPCRRVLDVGCGAGAFAARLAQRSEQVDAVDRSAEMIEEARRRTPHNVNYVLADVLADPLPDKDYDAIFSICALHHMPLQDALPVLAAALRPGGVLAAIALPRMDLRREWPVEIVAAVGCRLLGAMFLTKRLLGGDSWFAKDPTHVSMPVVMDPPLTTREAARQAAAVLPGVRVRRLLFWRYLLIWQKPITPELTSRRVLSVVSADLARQSCAVFPRPPRSSEPAAGRSMGKVAKSRELRRGLGRGSRRVPREGVEARRLTSPAAGRGQDRPDPSGGGRKARTMRVEHPVVDVENADVEIYYRCRRCGRAWQRSFDVIRWFDDDGGLVELYRYHGMPVPSPRSGPQCAFCSSLTVEWSETPLPPAGAATPLGAGAAVPGRTGPGGVPWPSWRTWPRTDRADQRYPIPILLPLRPQLHPRTFRFP